MDTQTGFKNWIRIWALDPEKVRRILVSHTIRSKRGNVYNSCLTCPGLWCARTRDITVTCLCDSSRCFMRTATTTLTSTNCAISTNMTKNIGAMPAATQQFFTQSAASSQSSRSASFMMPFQLSPVATRKSVRNAMPKLPKCACSPRPWHACSSLHSVDITDESRYDWMWEKSQPG